jgi:hypothetical protein
MASYLAAMKMTMHIDDLLLERVMKTYGMATKTDAVHFALKELDRRARLRVFAKEGLGLSPEDFADAIDPNSYESPAAWVAEAPKPYANIGPD